MLPTHRQSKRRTRKRRSHDALRRIHTVACPNCGSPKLPHAACANCGFVRAGLSLKTEEDQ